MLTTQSGRDLRGTKNLDSAASREKNASPSASNRPEVITVSNFEGIPETAQKIEQSVRQTGASGPAAEAAIANGKYAAVATGEVKRSVNEAKAPDKKEKTSEKPDKPANKSEHPENIEEDQDIQAKGLRDPKNLALSALWGKDPQLAIAAGNAGLPERNSGQKLTEYSPNLAQRDGREQAAAKERPELPPGTKQPGTKHGVAAAGLDSMADLSAGLAGNTQNLSTQSLFGGCGPLSRESLQLQNRAPRRAA